MQKIKKWVGIVLIAGCSVSVADASCTLTLCRAKGHGYDCHQVTDSPEWVCRQAQSAAVPASTPAPQATHIHTHTHTHTHSAEKTSPSSQQVPTQPNVPVPEPDLLPELAPDVAPELETTQPAPVVVPPQQ